MHCSLFLKSYFVDVYFILSKCDFFLNPQSLETPALQQLSFTVRRGELLAVIGPVGAGKVSLDAYSILWGF